MYDVPVAVKDALRSGMYKKNYRFVVLNDDGTADFTIDNDNLVSESVLVDERMCSGDELKFGLCEGSSLEFQYFGKANITGKRVQVFVDVEYEGIEDVEELTLNVTFSTKYRTAYYYFQDSDYYRLYGTDASLSFVRLIPVDGDTDINFETQSDGSKVAVIGDLINDYEGFYVVGTESNAKVMLQKMGKFWHSIPLGFFDVKNCSRQASTGIIKVSCYNKLQSDYLDAKANILIEGIQSDTSDANKITLKTIQDLLLQDYEIKYKETTTVIGGDGTPASYLENTPTFKVNGQSTTYYPFIRTQYLYFDSDPTKRCKINLANYLTKLKACIADLKSTIMDDLQNASTFWANFLNSALYQMYCSVIVVYGNGSIINGFFCLEDEPPSSKYASSIINYGVLEKLEYLYGVSTIGFRFPIEFGGSTSSSSYQNFFTEWTTAERISLDDVAVEEVATDSIEAIELSRTDLPDVTLRDIVSANYELHCTFGQLSRVTDLFSGVELNHSRLLPADTLYPSDSLYPDGAAESAFRSQYSKLWADEGNVRKWRYLIITYKGLDGDNNEAEFTLQRTVNADGTDDYNMSDNWLFRNLIWTASDVGDYADAMVAKMQDVTWFPFEMWCAGLPYLETGDEIEIPLGEETYTSYILQRQLKGIQNLQDTYINGTLDIF